jgi:hypothetical protein
MIRIRCYRTYPTKEDGHYLKSFDPDAYDGIGKVVLTPHEAEALTLGSAAEAMELWRKQSTVRPLRDDGRPNRPLSAFTIEIERITNGENHPGVDRQDH